MSEHLPECDSLYWALMRPVPVCICERLRACETRVLDAARDATLSACGHEGAPCANCRYQAHIINPLRGERG